MACGVVKEDSRDIFSGRILRLALERHLLPDGRRADFEMVRHPGGAAVLPVLEDGSVVLIRQWRPSVSGAIVEIPAGRLEPGETPEQCVHRELEEEVGYRARRMDRLGQLLVAAGYCDEQVHLFVASGLESIPARPEQDEFIEAFTCSLDQALEMVDRGEIPDSKTQLALLLYARRVLNKK